MKWFQHSVDSHEDPDISDAEDEFGDAGYTVFFKTLEIYGREFRRIDENGRLELSKSKLSRNLRKKWKRIRLILSFYQERQRIFFTENEKRITFSIPKFVESASNWTKRQSGTPTEAPTEEPTEAPTAIEVEEEVEVNITNKKPQSFALPSQEEITESSIPKVKVDIKKTCKELYETGIFPKANAFANKCLKLNYNPRAILHTLTRVFNAKPKVPWAYSVQIMKVEDGNFNERDFNKTT